MNRRRLVNHVTLGSLTYHVSGRSGPQTHSIHSIVLHDILFCVVVTKRGADWYVVQQAALHKTLHCEWCCLHKHVQSRPWCDSVKSSDRIYGWDLLKCIGDYLNFGRVKAAYIKKRNSKTENRDKLVDELKETEPIAGTLRKESKCP
jgi:hypothetical protein